MLYRKSFLPGLWMQALRVYVKVSLFLAPTEHHPLGRCVVSEDL
jgi:hypothetical protein